MTYQELRELLRGEKVPNEANLADLVMLCERYPYSSALHRLILGGWFANGDLRFASELNKRALYISDLSKLFFMLKQLGTGSLSTIDASNPDHEQQSAFDIIDAFLADHPDDGSEINMLIPSEAVNDRQEPYVASDYFDEGKSDAQPAPINILDNEEQQEDSMEIISAFLQKGEEAEQIAPQNDKTTDRTAEETPMNLNKGLGNNEAPFSPVAEEELFTETLARIYIKQCKYDKALRIIQSLHLNNPKKSSYFAEQISYLEKLIGTH